MVFFQILIWIYCLCLAIIWLHFYILKKGTGKYHQKQINEFYDIFNSPQSIPIWIDPLVFTKLVEIILSQLKMFLKVYLLKKQIEGKLKKSVASINFILKNRHMSDLFPNTEYNLKIHCQNSLKYIETLVYCKEHLGYDSNYLNSLDATFVAKVKQLSN